MGLYLQPASLDLFLFHALRCAIDASPTLLFTSDSFVRAEDYALFLSVSICMVLESQSRSRRSRSRVRGLREWGGLFLCASPFFAPLTVHHPVSTRYVGREIVVSVVSCPQSTTVAGFRDDAYTFNFWLRSG